jgi:uncharacterized Rmd1/YagE family protein
METALIGPVAGRSAPVGTGPGAASRPDDDLFLGVDSLPVRSICLGSAIDVRRLRRGPNLTGSPLTSPVGESGRAVFFRYGAVVLFGVGPDDEDEVLRDLSLQVTAPLDRPIVETTELVRVPPGGTEGVDGNRIAVEDFTLPRLQIVAEVLARSVVLDRFEGKAAAAFEAIQPVAVALKQARVRRPHGRLVAKLLGDVLVDRQEMIGRVEVTENPDLLWEHSEIGRLYAKLMDEFEIADRYEALEGKHAAISEAAETVIEVLHSRSSLRVEWYIVILIVVEIFLTLYEMFWQGH